MCRHLSVVRLFQISHQCDQFLDRLFGISAFSLNGDSSTFSQAERLQFEQALGTSRFAATADSDIALDALASLTNWAAGRVCRPFSAVITTDFSNIIHPNQVVCGRP